MRRQVHSFEETRDWAVKLSSLKTLSPVKIKIDKTVSRLWEVPLSSFDEVEQNIVICQWQEDQLFAEAEIGGKLLICMALQNQDAFL